MMRKSEDQALWFFREVVDPTVTEFMSDTADVRRGCAACLVLAAMSEHFLAARPHDAEGCSTPQQFRGALRAKNWAFGQVVDVSNATKHVHRTPKRIGFEDIGAQNIHVGNMRCNWPINGREVMVETQPGRLWLLKHLVQTASEMWRNKLGLSTTQPDP